MKIKEKTFSDKALSEYDHRNYLGIEVDGNMKLSFLDGEPEDANLSRDFSGCHSIVGLMSDAYMAGVRGEGFEVDYVETDEPE
jgi:hypothetical protein